MGNHFSLAFLLFLVDEEGEFALAQPQSLCGERQQGRKNHRLMHDWGHGVYVLALRDRK